MIPQARTRAILAALGIPVWGVRSQSTHAMPVVSLWGRVVDSADTAQAEPMTAPSVASVAVQQPIPVVESPVQAAQTLTALRSSLAVSEPVAVIPAAVKVPSSQIGAADKPNRQPFAQPIVATETVHVEQVLRFSLEARVIGEWVVLVSVQALSHPDRRALWQNLIQAFSAGAAATSNEVSRLDWPLADGARWQHNVGAQAALLGFLTRFGRERRIGLMGELPDTVLPEHLERLPSLDELLQEPLKKRTLWRLLAGRVR